MTKQSKKETQIDKNKEPIIDRKEVKIINLSEEIVGTYKNKPIHKFITTETLEVFEFDCIYNNQELKPGTKFFLYDGLAYSFNKTLDLEDISIEKDK